MRPPRKLHKGHHLERAGDRARTGDIQLGRLTLYQLSYSRRPTDETSSREPET